MTGLVTKAAPHWGGFCHRVWGKFSNPLVFNTFFLRNFSPSRVLYLWTSHMCIAPIFFWKGIYVTQGDQENQSFIHLIVCQGSDGGEIWVLIVYVFACYQQCECQGQGKKMPGPTIDTAWLDDIFLSVQLCLDQTFSHKGKVVLKVFWSNDLILLHC